MRTPLPLLLLAPLAALLAAGCATGPKFAALPPPAPDAGEPPPAADAPTRWVQPFALDDASPRQSPGGFGLLYAQYAYMNEAKTVTWEIDYSTKVKVKTKPLFATLPAAYFTKEVGFYGLAYGEMPIEFGAVKLPAKVVGLYEGVRVPITLADFKKADVQLYLVPGLTLQVLMTVGGEDLGYKTDVGMIAGGSLNGAGLGVSFGGRFMIEADFVKWGWHYFMLSATAPGGQSLTASFSAFSWGLAPVVFARAMW